MAGIRRDMRSRNAPVDFRKLKFIGFQFAVSDLNPLPYNYGQLHAEYRSWNVKLRFSSPLSVQFPPDSNEMKSIVMDMRKSGYCELPKFQLSKKRDSAFMKN